MRCCNDELRARRAIRRRILDDAAGRHFERCRLARNRRWHADPARARRVHKAVPLAKIGVDVGPIAAFVDDEAEERRATRARKRYGYFAIPVVMLTVVREENGASLVDGEGAVGRAAPAAEQASPA